MPRTEYVLGIDLGTSGLKAVLVGVDGRVGAVATSGYAFEAPEPGRAEIDPAVWEGAARAAVRDVLRAQPEASIAAVGVDGQMHGLVLVDGAGDAVGPALLWPDHRARDVVDRWLRDASPAAIAALGNPLAAGMAGPMLGWIREHQPERYARAVRFLSPKDWLRSRLVPGSMITDPSDASATLLWSVPDDDWHTALMAEVGVDPALCPEVRPSTEAAGRIDAATAASWRLPAGIPVAVGSGDVAATLVSIESADAELSVILGSGAQALSWRVPPAGGGRPRFHTFRAADERSFAMAATLNGGLALQNAMALLGLDWAGLYAAPFLSLRQEDPVFLPYFAAERIPEAIEPGGAGWSGVHASCTREVLAAAAVEGMLFGLRRAIEALPAGDGTAQLVGGGGTDPRVRQLLADVLARPVLSRDLPNATAVGAARLALRMLGTDAAPVPEAPGTLTAPRAATDERYARFRRLTEELLIRQRDAPAG